MNKLIIMKLIVFYSQLYNLDPQVSLAVAKTESQLNINALSKTGDLGVFQLNPKSFPQYSKKELLNPYINIPEGIKYLAKMQKECNHKINNQWLICYNYGKRNSNKVKHPELFPYVLKINLAMENL